MERRQVRTVTPLQFEKVLEKIYTTWNYIARPSSTDIARPLRNSWLRPWASVFYLCQCFLSGTEKWQVLRTAELVVFLFLLFFCFLVCLLFRWRRRSELSFGLVTLVSCRIIRKLTVLLSLENSHDKSLSYLVNCFVVCVGLWSCSLLVVVCCWPFYFLITTRLGQFTLTSINLGRPIPRVLALALWWSCFGFLDWLVTPGKGCTV